MIIACAQVRHLGRGHAIGNAIYLAGVVTNMYVEVTRATPSTVTTANFATGAWKLRRYSDVSQGWAICPVETN
jgi:hypothetical protein